MTAVKQEWVISAYRPSVELEERFKLTVRREDSAWEFVRSHLHQLQPFVVRGDRLETVAERQKYVSTIEWLLFASSAVLPSRCPLAIFMPVYCKDLLSETGCSSCQCKPQSTTAGGWR